MRETKKVFHPIWHLNIRRYLIQKSDISMNKPKYLNVQIPSINFHFFAIFKKRNFSFENRKNYRSLILIISLLHIFYPTKEWQHLKFQPRALPPPPLAKISLIEPFPRSLKIASHPYTRPLNTPPIKSLPPIPAN